MNYRESRTVGYTLSTDGPGSLQGPERRAKRAPVQVKQRVSAPLLGFDMAAACPSLLCSGQAYLGRQAPDERRFARKTVQVLESRLLLPARSAAEQC